MAGLHQPESASVNAVSRKIDVGAAALERWRSDALSTPGLALAWTAAALLEAVLTTAAMDEAARSAWCREQGLYPQDLENWMAVATLALALPGELGTPRSPKEARRRIKKREMRRKDTALDEAAALLVLSKKLSAIFDMQGEGE